MKLTRVTITGVDDRTDLTRVRHLTERFPFVEWAVLLSQSRQGYEPRYPSLRTMADLRKQAGDDAPLAAHLCGSFAREVASGRSDPLIVAKTLVPSAGRVQVNLGHGIDQFPDAFLETTWCSSHAKVPVILQTYTFDLSLRLSVDRATFAPYLFHDASGGLGKDTVWEPPINERFTGYAGGIGPENVVQKIESLLALPNINEFWIDSETRVRTNDWLDLDKVEALLGAAEPLVTLP